MTKTTLLPLLAFGASAALLAAAYSVSAETASLAPPPKAPAAAAAGPQTIVLAGGCFWGVQAVYQHVNGVTRAVSGYAGGHVQSPGYEQVSSGETGAAESVQVTYDPQKVSLGEILRIYVSVAHDPTEINRQGPDVGTQYRSEIFAADAAQAEYARAYVAELDAARAFPRKLATKVEAGASFYPAEGYHQDYATRFPNDPYIAANDAPKLQNLKRLFPADWRDQPALVAAR